MGIFDGFKMAVGPQLDEQKAIMIIVVSAIKSDGEVSDQEVFRLRGMCAHSPIYARNTKDQDTSLISFADNFTSQLGNDAVAKAAEILSQDLRETAFSFACDMILADGIVGAGEESFLTELADELGIAENVGQAVVLTTLIRNRSV